MLNSSELSVSNPELKQLPTNEVLTQDELTRFAAAIKYDIDEASKKLFESGNRSHLGASLIGDNCSRKLWYIFRWVQKQNFNGRMQRLFNRGHRMESVFIDLLRLIGFNVLDFSSQSGEQFRIIGVNGHYGGGLDGIGDFPSRYVEWLAKLGKVGKILLEFKTHKDSQYKRILKEGMQKSHPKHFAQCSSYGYAYGFDYVLYCPVNKDTDDVDFQLVRLNHDLGRSLVAKADSIIYSQEPPARIAQTPAYFECKFCNFLELCHYGTGELAHNCRSCINAVPVNNGEWRCNKFDNIIPASFIPNGCNEWSSIA